MVSRAEYNRPTKDTRHSSESGRGLKVTDVRYLVIMTTQPLLTTGQYIWCPFIIQLLNRSLCKLLESDSAHLLRFGVLFVPSLVGILFNKGVTSPTDNTRPGFSIDTGGFHMECKQTQIMYKLLLFKGNGSPSTQVTQTARTPECHLCYTTRIPPCGIKLKLLLIAHMVKVYRYNKTVNS